MTKLSPEAQALLDQGRAALTPSAETKAQVLRSLDASLASTGAAAGASAGALSAGKLWLVLALVAGVGGGWLLFRDGGTTKPVTETAAPQVEPEVIEPEVVEPEVVEPEVVEPVAVVETEAPKPAPAASVEAPPTKKNPKPRRSAAEQARLERELIAKAQRAIRAGDFAGARAQLRAHKREFASGLLSPERQAASAIVECLDPQAVNGKAVARRFLQAHPSSPLAPRVRSSCDVP